MRRLLAAVLFTAAVAACDTSPTNSTDLSADAGNYALRTLNDTVLPYTILNTATLRLEVLGDTLFLGVNGSFTDRTHYRRTQNSVIDFPADTTSGSWSERGSTVTFKATSGEVFVANFVGSQLVIVGSGLRAVYTK